MGSENGAHGQFVPLHLVTGAGSGIGAALAARLTERGDDLVLLARSAERAEQLAALYPGARTVVADLTNLSSVVTMEFPGRLDSVCHAAGLIELGTVSEQPVKEWMAQLTVNLLAPMALTQRALPALRAARGTVLFINSAAGLQASRSRSGYAASKFGLRALADSLRAEEREHGVRVSTLYPGRTATPMQQKVHEQEGEKYDAADWIQPDTLAKAILHVLDLPREATIPDLVVSPR